MAAQQAPRLRCLWVIMVLVCTALGNTAWASEPSGEPAQSTDSQGKPAESHGTVVLQTDLGAMRFRLLGDEAPHSVANFKRLVQEGFYDGKPFYRVVAGHVIQAGDRDGNDQPTVRGEFGAHKHVEGALGLARGSDPDSGSTEIYICLADRPHLDGSYAIFAMLSEGVDVLRRLGTVPVRERWIGKVAMHEPLEPLRIRKAYLEP